MKLDILNNSQDTIEVQYTLIDGADVNGLINPGRTSLPDGAILRSSHPSIKVLNGGSSGAVQQFNVAPVVPTPEVKEKPNTEADVVIEVSEPTAQKGMKK
jgi:hypothetical protein